MRVLESRARMAVLENILIKVIRRLLVVDIFRIKV
jgi:hypothetical protein